MDSRFGLRRPERDETVYPAARISRSGADRAGTGSGFRSGPGGPGERAGALSTGRRKYTEARPAGPAA